MRKSAVWMFLLCCGAFAQQTVDNTYADKTLPFSQRVTERSSCTVGETYWNQATSKLRWCGTTNTWSDLVPASTATLAGASDYTTNLVNPLALKAPLASPVFTGTVQAPTYFSGTQSISGGTSARINSSFDNIATDRATHFAAHGITNPALHLWIGIATQASPAYADFSVLEDAVAWRDFVFNKNGGSLITGASAGVNTGSGASIQAYGPGIQIVGGTQPTCDAAHRGEINVVGATHSAGVKDSVVVCAADAANAYTWRTLY